MNLPSHIVDLLEDFRDGALTESQHAALIAWLRDSDENAKSAAAWFAAEAELVEATRVANMCSVFETLPIDVHADRAAGDHAVAGGRRWHAQHGLLALAAMLLVALTVPLFNKYRSQTNLAEREGRTDQATAASAESPADGSAAASAILGRIDDCVWGPSTQPLRVGQDITPGTAIEIQSGLAQLIFECGAKVVLQGPCEMRIENSMRCNLAYGSASAEVPPRAAGFTIRGPSTEVIDLGTRFGFSVGRDGESEVHVFKGEVISRQFDERGKIVGDEILLTTNQAIFFPGEKKQARRMAADEAKFALVVPPLWLNDSIEPLTIERRVALWLRAGHGVQTDSDQRVIAWQDLAIGENLIANDAFQPVAKSRPRYLPDALGGKPALRFDGQASFLTTTPVRTTDDQTIVVVFQYLKNEAGKKHRSGQIINYNGPPSRFLPDVHNPGVLQLGERIDRKNLAEYSIAAKAFIGRDSRGQDVSTGVVYSNSLAPSIPHVVAYTYNHARNVSALYVDGKRIDTASAPTRVAVTSRKVIGKHGIFDQWYFHGDLGEVVIFNAALTPREIASLSQQLSEFYGGNHAGSQSL